MTLNSSKFQFRCDELTYLGHTISKDGINADANKIRAITEMSIPGNKKAVQHLLGMINYVGKFIPNLAEINEENINAQIHMTCSETASDKQTRKIQETTQKTMFYNN